VSAIAEVLSKNLFKFALFAGNASAKRAEFNFSRFGRHLGAI
jgi:hypothetical protein